MNENQHLHELQRIANALERISPPPSLPTSLMEADAFIWSAERKQLVAVKHVSHVPLSLLQGIDHVRDILLANTQQFAKKLPANNALLWGARGTGKSSLVKAVHAHINTENPRALALIEIHREDIETLPLLLEQIATSLRQCVLFCDDLSFDKDDTTYKSLKAVLEGGIAGKPDNVILYATSNRRHLMPRDMMDNERSTAINPGEAVEEKVSLSDRFGLWLGFHSCSQETYLAMIDAYAQEYHINTPKEKLHAEALAWATTRGARSGRVAVQFMQDVAGRLRMHGAH